MAGCSMSARSTVVESERGGDHMTVRRTPSGGRSSPFPSPVIRTVRHMGSWEGALFGVRVL